MSETPGTPSSRPRLTKSETTLYWQLIQTGRADLVVDLTRQHLARNPLNSTAQLYLAEALVKLNRIPEALEAAEGAVALAPEWCATHFILARARWENGHSLTANEPLAEALRLDPLRAYYHGWQAQLFFFQKRYPEAVAAADTGLRLDPQHADVLLWRAEANEALRRPHLADQDYRRLFDVSPNYALAHHNRGISLLRRFLPAAASEHLAEALRIEPERAPELTRLLNLAWRWQNWPRWLAGHRAKYQASLAANPEG
ncbi:hypothetical protein A0257_20150 [Hymenobacter psoromatis]|nr:hypothetical protein A0257_20150 [Hymenobacter psoromatis]